MGPPSASPARAAGLAAACAAALAGAAPALVVPSVPTGVLSHANTGSTVLVTWSAPDPGEAGSFEIGLRHPPAEDFQVDGTAPRGARSYQRGATQGEVLEFRVRATDGVDASDWSEASTVEFPVDTFTIAPTRATFVDSSRESRDRLAVQGTTDLHVDGMPFFPDQHDLNMALGAPTHPLLLTIAAGTSGWKTTELESGRRLKFRSPRGQWPRVSFQVDEQAGTFRIGVTRAEMPQALEGTGTISILAGPDGAWFTDLFTSPGPGKWTFP